VSDKRGIVAVNRAWGVKQDGKQIFLDTADFRCVVLHAIKHKFKVCAVQIQKLRFHQFGGI
jgi:hypothetical protein